MDTNLFMTDELRAENRTEFDRLSTILINQGKVLANVKSDIATLRNKFVKMIEIITSPAYSDHMTVLEKQLYDLQCKSFLHSIYMYLMTMDANGTPYINPVIPQSQTTDISVTIKLPHYTITKTIATMDNMTIDI